MISVLLIKKIVELFIVLVDGYVATRMGLLHTNDATDGAALPAVGRLRAKA